MSLSRKHFYALARLCVDEHLNHDQVHAIAEFCKTFNKKFDRQRFYNAIDTHRRLMEDDRRYETSQLLERLARNG